MPSPRERYEAWLAEASDPATPSERLEEIFGTLWPPENVEPPDGFDGAMIDAISEAIVLNPNVRVEFLNEVKLVWYTDLRTLNPAMPFWLLEGRWEAYRIVLDAMANEIKRFFDENISDEFWETDAERYAEANDEGLEGSPSGVHRTHPVGSGWHAETPAFTPGRSAKTPPSH